MACSLPACRIFPRPSPEIVLKARETDIFDRPIAPAMRLVGIAPPPKPLQAARYTSCAAVSKAPGSLPAPKPLASLADMPRKGRWACRPGTMKGIPALT